MTRITASANDLLPRDKICLNPHSELARSVGTGSEYPQSFCGQTFSVPRRLVVFRVKIGQLHLGQASLTGSFHTAYLQSG